MPIYIFENPKTGEKKEVVQKMNDEHEYSEEGVKWQRVFTKPRAAIDTQVDKNSEKDFARVTASKNMTVGEMWDYSKELSEKRGGDAGDEVKNKTMTEYEQTTGKKHPHRKKKIETKDIEIEL